MAGTEQDPTAGTEVKIPEGLVSRYALFFLTFQTDPTGSPTP